MPAHTDNPDRATALSKKVYFYDNGLASVLAQVGEGALFENAVFCQLHPFGGPLSYLARGNDYEVDFILQPHFERLRPLRVKTHPVPRTSKS
ncbi:MAG: DUF4143 domain-containing protein [Dehalococcoidia bacterium]|nr:DUF4143 domain-containing protein [Dehalococcoidia bacterium]